MSVLPKALAFAGRCLVALHRFGRRVVGAIGVSGVTSQQDEVVAQAGVNVLK